MSVSGVTAIYVVEGRVIAHASDFNRSRPAGFTVQEAQEHRARERLACEVIKELSSPLLYNNMDAYTCEQILRKLPGSTFVLPVSSPVSES